MDKVEEIIINTYNEYPHTEEEELLLSTLDKARKAMNMYWKINNNIIYYDKKL